MYESPSLLIFSLHSFRYLGGNKNTFLLIFVLWNNLIGNKDVWGGKNTTLRKLWWKEFVKSEILGSAVNDIHYKMFLLSFCVR